MSTARCGCRYARRSRTRTPIAPTLARSELRQVHDISEVCTVCGGDGCGMFFCYVTGK